MFLLRFVYFELYSRRQRMDKNFILNPTLFLGSGARETKLKHWGTGELGENIRRNTAREGETLRFSNTNKEPNEQKTKLKHFDLIKSICMYFVKMKFSWYLWNKHFR